MARTALEDEDFKARYGAGMPDYLRAAAVKNLGAEDAALAKVNAVSRLVTPQEGFARVAQYQEPGTVARTSFPGGGAYDFNAGTVTGNVPASRFSLNPETDFGISDAMEASQRDVGSNGPTLSDTHFDDIAERRAQIDGKQLEIKARLGLVDPRDAGMAAVVLAGPKERKDLLLNLHALEGEKQNLLQEHHYAAVENARNAHETFAREKHADAANDFASLATRLTEVRKSTARGTPEREAAILQAAVDHPAGFQTQAGQTLVRQMAGEHDAAAALKNRATPPAAVEERYARLLGDIRGHEDSSKEEEAANIAAKLVNVPYSKAEKYHAAQTELQRLVKRYPSLAADSDAGVAEETGATEGTKKTAGTNGTNAEPPPNITPEAHAVLKPGDKFWWNGKQLTKK